MSAQVTGTEIRLIFGFTAIRRALGVKNRASVYDKATRVFDPLRLRMNATSGRVYIYSDRLADWIRRDESRKMRLGFDPSIPSLTGVADIRAALGGMSKTRMWEMAKRTHDPLPIQGIGTRQPWAYACALRDWFEGQDAPYRVKKAKEHGRAEEGQTSPHGTSLRRSRPWSPSASSVSPKSSTKPHSSSLLQPQQPT